MRTRVIVCVTVLTLIAAALPRACISQWKKLATLPSPANTIYFLDKQGSPKVGFAGCRTDIMRTTDGGQTWRSVQNTFGAYVRDFVFWDALNGIAVCSAAPVFFRTTDGGATWDFSPCPGGATSISYAIGTGILTVNSTQPFGPCKYSLDSGITWARSSVPEDQNGMIFSGPFNGIFAAHNTGAPLYWTTDGAQSWTPTTFYEHVYSPIAIDDQPGAFLTVGELSGQCWFSHDGGKTWTQRSQLPAGVLPTGCTRYHNGNVWIQSQAQGFFLSTDLGNTWHSICGPPQIADSRFYSVDSTLYASSALDGGFWTIHDGRVTAVASETDFLPSPIRITASSCAEGWSDFTVATTACYEQLDTVTYKGSPRIQMSPAFIKVKTALGAPLDFIFNYTPAPNIYFDTGFVHIVWGADGNFHDTTIAVYAAVATGATGSYLTTTSLKHSSCSGFDTAIDLRTSACDTSQVLQCHLVDSTNFRLLGLPALPFKLYPFHDFRCGLRVNALPTGTYTALIHMRILGANGTVDTTYAVTLTVSGAPSPIAGPAYFDPAVLCDEPDSVMWIHNPYCGAITLEHMRSASPNLIIRDSILPITIQGYDSIPLHLTVVPKEGHFVWLMFMEFKVAGQMIDTILYVISDGTIVHLSMPAFRASPKTICNIVDTIVWIYAPKCIPARVDSLRLSSNVVTLLDTTFPVTMNAGDSMPVHLRILPSHTPITATLFAYFFEDNVHLDTSYSLSVKVQSPIKPTPKLDPVPLRFGLTPWCSGKSLPLHIFNNKCQAMKVVRIAWVISDTQIWYDTVPLPLTILPGTMDSILFRYKPSALKQTTVQVRLTFDLADLRQDTVITISGIGIDTGIALIEPDLLSYDTISKCNERIDTAIFNNVSCDTMTLESFADWQKNGYEVISPTLPIAVQPGETVPIVIRLKRNSNGAANDSLDFAYYSTKPPHTPLLARLKLYGTIQTHLASLELRAVNFDSVHLAPCSEFDSFIIVHNSNICDSLIVSSLSGSGISETTILPLVLQPGEQDTIRFHYVPSCDTDVTQLHVQGTKLDTSVSLSTYRVNAGTVTCLPTTLAAFIAPMCHVASDSVLLTAGGCDSTLIDRIEIDPPQSNFRVVQHYSIPFGLSKSLRVTISYDPSRGGSDTASVYLHSANGALDLRIPLRGITTTLQTARLGIHNATNTLTTYIAVPEHAIFTLFTDDNIPDSLKLSEIDCNLSLNSDILTMRNVQPGPHIAVVSSSQSGNITSLILHRIDAASLPASSLLATLDFSTTLSDTIATDVSYSTDVAVASVRFNPAETDYERCILAPLADATNISVSIDPSCMRDLLTNFMAGRGILTSIRVHPSVLTGSDEIVLDLNALKETTATVRVVDELGIEECHLQIPVKAGVSSHVLPHCQLSRGLKFVQIGAEGTLTTERVIVIQ